MPGVSGVTVVTTLVCFLFCMRGCGRIERPAFPAPSDGEQEFPGKTRAAPAARPRSRVAKRELFRQSPFRGARRREPDRNTAIAWELFVVQSGRAKPFAHDAKRLDILLDNGLPLNNVWSGMNFPSLFSPLQL